MFERKSPGVLTQPTTTMHSCETDSPQKLFPSLPPKWHLDWFSRFCI